MKHTIQDLKRLMAEAKARAATPKGQPRDDVRQIVVEEIARLFPAPAAEFIREDNRLRDMGLDDLDLVGLALALEARLDLPTALDIGEWHRVVDVVRAAGRAAAAG